MPLARDASYHLTRRRPRGIDTRPRSCYNASSQGSTLNPVHQHHKDHTMTAPNRMKFGVFMAPFHRPGENPTLALERDLELLQWLDKLGFDEAYIGEHHSAGWETICSPEVFIATAAERTQHIRLGTGVVSLPYHHPYMVANRMVLLDHLTRGRVILGVGPGALASDALMFGIPPERQREMMDESLGVIMRLFESTAPLTV